jgi:CheY-like chemotaxis protein
VIAIALGDESDGSELARRLEPLGIPVHTAGTGERASELVARARPDLTVVDVCESDAPALDALRSDLSSLDPDEIHLTLPATVSATAGKEALDRHRMLGVTHLCLTHADATDHPGAPLGLAMDRRLSVSYLCTRATTEPADAAALAARLLP